MTTTSSECGKRPGVSGRDAAGILLYREIEDELEVLLVHPSGWYNKKAPWSIPKGLPERGETMEQAALRETLEETGVAVEVKLVSLDIVTKGRQTSSRFCAPCAGEAAPSCASWEVDCVGFVPLSEARRILHPVQTAFLDRLVSHLGRSADARARVSQ